jgi:methyl-accepting chemotaxis protein
LEVSKESLETTAKANEKVQEVELIADQVASDAEQQSQTSDLVSENTQQVLYSTQEVSDITAKVFEIANDLDLTSDSMIATVERFKIEYQYDNNLYLDATTSLMTSSGSGP